MAISSLAAGICSLIFTSFTIKEITSSSIGYAILVPLCALLFLILLCSCVLVFLSLLLVFRSSRINPREPVVWWKTSTPPFPLSCSEEENLALLYPAFTGKNAKSRPDTLYEILQAAGANERFCCAAPTDIGYAAPRVLYKGYVEWNNYLRIRPGNSISRPPQELEPVKLVHKLSPGVWAHYGNGGIEQKVYKKSRTAHPGKHGHNVGSTAFRNWAHGGDGSGEDRAIQDDWVSPGTTVNRSVHMTSPQVPPPPTPPPPPQTFPSPILRAAPQVQPPTPASQVQRPTPTPQVQPPIPTTPPAPAPPPPPPPPPRGWFNFNFTGWFTSNFAGWFNFNVPSLAKIFLAISATLVLAPPQIVQGGGNSLSANDKTLLFGTKLFGLAGFIFCLLAYIVQQDNIAAKLLIAFGVVADIFGLLLIVALGR